jgi:hypothetical protein
MPAQPARSMLVVPLLSQLAVLLACFRPPPPHMLPLLLLLLLVLRLASAALWAAFCASAWTEGSSGGGWRSCSGVCAKKQHLRLQLVPSLQSSVLNLLGCSHTSNTPCAYWQASPSLQEPFL